MDLRVNFRKVSASTIPASSDTPVEALDPSHPIFIYNIFFGMYFLVVLGLALAFHDHDLHVDLEYIEEESARMAWLTKN